MVEQAGVFATACLLAVLLLPGFNKLAMGFGWLDLPTHRKVHDGAVPLSGGITIAVAWLATMLVAAASGLVGGAGRVAMLPVQAPGVVAGFALCLLAGLADDRHPVRARYRMMAQCAAVGCAMVGGDAIVRSLGQTFVPVEIGLGLLALPFTLVAMAGLVNAYNMSDGLDGLCASYVAVALAALLGCAALLQAGSPTGKALAELAPLLVPALGAVAGFLVYNARHPWRAKAAAFLGDGGSMSLGFLVAWAAVRLASPDHGLPPAVAVWFVALPVADLFSCILRRLGDGASPSTPDRRHLHHLLLAQGLTVGRTTAALAATAAAMSAAAIGAWQAGVAPWVLFWSLVALFGAYHVQAVRFWRARDRVAQPATISPGSSWVNR